MTFFRKDRFEIGERLRELRLAAGLTQAQTSEKADIAARTYAEIERGNAGMRVETFVRLCEALGVTPNDVLLPARDTAFSDETVVELYHLLDPDGTRLLRLASYLEKYAKND